MDARKSIRRCLVHLLLLPAFALPLRAGTMLSPTAVLGTDLGTFDPQTPVENMINQSGLDKPFTSGVTDFDEYFTTGAQPFGQGSFVNGWQSDFTFNLPLMGFVDFDLGAVVSINRIAIWNRSLDTGNFLVSETLGGPMTNAGSFDLDNLLHFPFSYRPEIVELNGTHQARYLRFEITSTHKFDITDTFAYAIVGEVVVDTTTSIPGDFDNDLDVDGDDLTQWQGDFGLNGESDDDNDNDSDGADFMVWQQQVGSAPIAGAVISVPEPGSLLLAWLAACGLIALGRRAAAA